MAFNPFQLMQYREMLTTFLQNHPKLPLFLKAVSQDGLSEGTILETTVKTPDGKEYCTNIKLTASDMELIQKLKQDGGFS
ncbi:MAG TPA: hypothetical protein IAB60_00470 [Candidatus Caccovicinus merdipullorum]|uniref:Uncharacterized protein n=1 Tax=Candidatus Caccovicinus merdipullorum TaxID=2840724 RepID=A0A9D1KED3_9FIRM|nr:hypothetical protein [Candidatus Caccovicinus merdipullorum]